MRLATERMLRPLHAARQVRAADVLGSSVMLAGFLALLFLAECIAISLLDWAMGRPHTVIPALVAFLETLDGGI